MKYKLIFKVLMLVVLLLGVAVSGKSQSTKTYKGKYNFYGFEGEAIYDYIRVNRDSTVKDGKFGFVQKQTDSLDLRSFNRIQATGTYRKDKKVGPWEYLESRNRVDVKDVVFFNVKAALESMQFETNASYNSEGAPHGRWSYKVLRYKNEVVTDLLTAPNLPFVNGSIAGPFSFSTDQKDGYYGLYSIRGQCTNTGHMDSLWVFRYMRDTLQIREYRYYDQGFLTRVVKLSDNGSGDTLFQVIDRETIEKLKVLRSGSSSLFKVSDRDFEIDYISGFDETDRRYLTQLHGNNYLKELFEAITKFDIYYYYGESRAIKLPVKTKRFEFAILPSEDSLRLHIKENYEVLNNTLAELLTSNTFGLNYKRTDSLYYTNQYFLLVDSLVDRLRYPIEKAISDDFKYFDAHAYSKSRSFDFMNTDTLRFKFNQGYIEVVENFNAGLIGNEHLISRLDHYLKVMVARTADLMDLVNGEMKLIKIGDELESLQAEILEASEKLHEKFSEHKAFSKAEKELFKAVQNNYLKANFERFREDYGRDELEAGKVDKAMAYLNTLAGISDLLGPLATLYPNQSILDSLYQEEVFNPFTYSSYKRRVKEELFSKGQQLFDYYIGDIKQSSNLTKTKKLSQQVRRLQKRLEALRAQDTRSLERSLRGRKSPTEIQTLLELDDA